MKSNYIYCKSTISLNMNLIAALQLIMPLLIKQSLNWWRPSMYFWDGIRKCYTLNRMSWKPESLDDSLWSRLGSQYTLTSNHTTKLNFCILSDPYTISNKQCTTFSSQILQFCFWFFLLPLFSFPFLLGVIYSCSYLIHPYHSQKAIY